MLKNWIISEIIELIKWKNESTLRYVLSVIADLCLYALTFLPLIIIGPTALTIILSLASSISFIFYAGIQISVIIIDWFKNEGG